MLVSKPLAAVLFGGLLLTGCTYGSQAVKFAEGRVDQAVEVKRDQSDVEARAVLNLPCVITVGAFHRELTPREQAAVAELCGGGQPSPALSE